MKYKAVIISLLSIIAILFAVTITMITKLAKLSDKYYTSNKIISDYSYNQNVTSTSSEELKVSPMAKLVMKQHYKNCGHTTTNECLVPESIVNMNEDDVKKYYFGWEIKDFSSSNITMYREIIGKCDEHYIVKDDDGIVAVYREDENENVIFKTEIMCKYLPEEDYEKLKTGINIVGKDNLYELLQDFE